MSYITKKSLADIFSVLVIAMSGALNAAEIPAPAPDPAKPAAERKDIVPDELYGAYGQVTYVNQWHSGFRSPYRGQNSLVPNKRNNETADITLMLGRRLWNGAEFWINPEIDQGTGFSNGRGMAGFPNGEAYGGISRNEPYARIQRAFIRNVFSLEGPQENVEAQANQLGGKKPANNVTLTVGKFAVTDIFDANTYAHDSRNDFLNWSILDSGAFDYAADAWGYTNGAALEVNKDWWTLRGGLFQLPKDPTSNLTSPSLKQYSLVVEAEERHHIFERPGKLKLLAFVNHGKMGSYREATQLGQQMGATPDVALVRRAASRAGYAINLEQELAPELGMFARLSANDGSKEAYVFSDINQSIAAGISLRGARWSRPNDVFGFAGVINGLSSSAKSYFSAGGTGLQVGDGAMNYGPEKILETYYAFQLTPALNLAINYQHAVNPAYNRDRGPVSIYGVRVHAAF